MLGESKYGRRMQIPDEKIIAYSRGHPSSIRPDPTILYKKYEEVVCGMDIFDFLGLALYTVEC